MPKGMYAECSLLGAFVMDSGVPAGEGERDEEPAKILEIPLRIMNGS